VTVKIKFISSVRHKQSKAEA